MTENLAFATMAQLLAGKFLVVKDQRDSFAVIELGPFDSGESAALVYLSEGEHPAHIHDETDARFCFHSGEGVVIIGTERREIPYKAGTIVDVPKGTPHGFLTTIPGIFLVLESKPITDPDTGKVDLRYPDEA